MHLAEARISAGDEALIVHFDSEVARLAVSDDFPPFTVNHSSTIATGATLTLTPPQAPTLRLTATEASHGWAVIAPNVTRS